MPDRPLLLDRIRSLLDADSSPAHLAEIEHTLTDGYAAALALEAERLRMEREIGALARRLEEPANVRELRRLALRLAAAEDDLTRLRALLAGLRERADAVRAVARTG